MKRHSEPARPDAIETAAARWIARRDAGLSPVDERELADWLAADPRHREALAFHAAAWSALARPAATGNRATLRSQLGKAAARRRLRHTMGGACAVVALAFAAVVALRPPQPSPTDAASLAQVLMPERQTFSDGSIAELKENARIAVEFSSASRRVVLLSGEAHFDVQSDPARPFVVSVAGVEVRAVGTAFSVKKDFAAVEVVVTHGRVALEQETSAAGPSSAPLATLEAGTFAVIELTGAPQAQIRPIASAELAQRLGWRGPRLEFTRTPIAEAVDWFNRHAGPEAPQLAVVDTTLAATRVSGVFRADNAEAFVALLETAFDAKVERSGGRILLGQQLGRNR